ncbi:type VI secretion system protein TssA [Gammaproteobacteria bacterium AS21]
MMNINNKIAEPIHRDNPVGEVLIDDEQLDFIETELMKVGSLSHSSIGWAQVEESALNILCNKSKDIKVLANYMQCLQQQGNLLSLLNSLYVLDVFAANFWQQAYPIPGPKGEKLRAKLYKQMMQRSANTVKKLEYYDAQTTEIERVLKPLMKTLAAQSLDISLIESLQRSIEQGITDSHNVKESSDQSQDASTKTEQQVDAPKAPKVFFDSKNERATRQALMTMADFLNATDPENTLGYQIRRHALWFAIDQLPGTKKECITDLAAYSVDKYQDYCNSVVRSPSNELLKRLERSIEQAPFWFDGQHLSAQLCLKLGYLDIARVIQTQSQSFLERLPALINYCASDGSPFVNESTKQWLNEGTGNSTVGVSVGAENNWDDELNSVLATCQRSGLAIAMAQVEERLAMTSDMRQQFYWRKINADLLNQQGLTTLAKTQYQVLMDSAKGMLLDEWEPSFTQHLMQSLNIMDN